jgi:A/G-specific adenine glycosylase
MTPADPVLLRRRLLDWYAANARDLPWRRPGVSAYAVLVSEVMLQQTPVARVLPVYASWLERWPKIADLAAAPSGDAVRAWGRLGYPRRALRLHAAARTVVDRHGGEVPADVAALRALQGVGEYTAAAVASFAYGQRHLVLDTNVRRVFARVLGGEAGPPPSLRAHERAAATALLPTEPAVAAAWGVAVMEHGALVCTASAPRCPTCPVADLCRWRRSGAPPYEGPPRRTQRWHGTDRQCRGRLLTVLRDTAGSVPRSALEAAWPDPVQRDRALDGLVADGLVERLTGDLFALPH